MKRSSSSSCLWREKYVWKRGKGGGKERIDWEIESWVRILAVKKRWRRIKPKEEWENELKLNHINQREKFMTFKAFVFQTSLNHSSNQVSLSIHLFPLSLLIPVLFQVRQVRLLERTEVRAHFSIKWTDDLLFNWTATLFSASSLLLNIFYSFNLLSISLSLALCIFPLLKSSSSSIVSFPFLFLSSLLFTIR